MPTSETQVRIAADFLRGHVAAQPHIGIILGSGLGGYADTLPNARSIPTSEVPYFPKPSIDGHKGFIAFPRSRSGQSIVAFQGRTHFYESGDPLAVTFPIRVAEALGVTSLILTNAAGGINRNFLPGDLMLVSDQIRLTPRPWLSGQFNGGGKNANHPVYDQHLLGAALRLGTELGIPLRKGVYAGVDGPSYETAAEISMLHRIGADAVGMSTVLEAETAAHLGMRVLGVSCITNMATGISPDKLLHSDITEVAARASKALWALLDSLLEEIGSFPHQ